MYAHLVFDAHGGFWFLITASEHRPRTSDLTGIYYAKADGSFISEQVFPVEEPNGIGLSPDGNTVYWAETHNGRVTRRTIESPGVLSPAVPFDTSTCLAGLPGFQLLDSLAVDGDGNVCVATLPGRQYAAHRHRRSMTTNICFGDNDAAVSSDVHHL